MEKLHFQFITESDMVFITLMLNEDDILKDGLLLLVHNKFIYFLFRNLA